jgi:hypothetical protein
MNSTSLLQTFGKAQFQGRTDKYAPPSATVAVNLELDKVLKGTAPVDVSGQVLGDKYVQDSITRLSEYRRYMGYYKGAHFTVEWEGGHKKVPFNYCRKIINKRANWIAGKGFNFISDKGNELVSEFLMRVWESNQKRNLVRRTAKMSLVHGDAFWFFTVKTKDEAGKDLPRDKWHVRIYPINPAYVFPLFMENDPTKMKACVLQFPIWGNEAQKTQIFTAYYTANEVRFWIDYQEQSREENILGLIPIVHIPANVCGDNNFGSSILEDIIPLNEAYNEIAGSVQKILRYHGEPTTIVYGAKLANMERGANKVWSNLPAPNEAKVVNLEMQSDLTAAGNQLDRLESAIYRHGRTPKISFDSEGLAISNTSGIAMQLMFQPLIEASIEEQDNFEIAIKKGNEILAQIHKKVFGEDLATLADNPDAFLELDVVWQSLLPKDEQMEIDIAEKKIAMGIWSKAEAVRKLSGVKDTTRLALEIAADQRAEIAIAAEKQRALQVGENPPEFSAVFLSSLFVSEDLLDIASRLGKDAGRDSQLNDKDDDEE